MIERREFLRVSAAIGGGLLIAIRWPAPALGASFDRPLQTDEFVPNAFVRIASDGRVTVMINKAELGQGVTTSLPMIVAEELDADWDRVGFEFAPVDPVYAHPGFGIQMTGGSTSVAGMSETLRKAGASARALLVAAAAKEWGVDASACRTEKGAVLHDASGRRASYGELATAAAALGTSAAPSEPVLKDPKDYRLIGRSLKRLDTPAKVLGQATFAIDVVRPGMLTTVVVHPPVFGAKAKSVKADAARAIAGVVDVVEISSGVAVVATGFWPAKRGRDELKIEWDLGPNAKLSSDSLRAEYRRLARTPGKTARRDGDPAASFQAAHRVLEAEFELPYLAHATMEPQNCVVDLRDDACDIWAGTQFQTIDHAAAARVSGLPPDKVRIHSTFCGGGFGRRATPTSDVIVEAVEIAKAVRKPIKLVWTRDDDMRGGYYRPMWHSRIRAALTKHGDIDGWMHTIVGQSFIAGTPFESFIIHDGIDETSVEGSKDTVYAVPNLQVDLHTTQVGVPTLWWRSVGHTHTAFVIECFLDEIAHALGVDPLALRSRLLANAPRPRRVLELAAEKAGWGGALPSGRARGLAIHPSFGSFVAAVAEVSIENGRPRVHRYTCAIDCGRVVNPDGVVAQIEGAVGFGLTAALFSEITLRDGRVVQSNFHDYPMLRMPEMPKVDVHVVDSQETSSGVGEPGVPPIAPALANALFVLTGKPIRRLPIRSEDLRA